MNDSVCYVLLLTLVTGAVTIALRAFPFVLFGSSRRTPPEVIGYIGRSLSPAAIAMLVVYCFGAYAELRPPLDNFYGLAEISAAAVVVLLQVFVKNPLLSIIAGTALYMVLVQNGV